MSPKLIVAGAASLASALDASGQFERVISVNSTSELQQALATRPGTKTDLAFLFADTLTVNTAASLETLIQKLSTTGWHVFIVEMTPAARQLAATYPAAHLLSAPEDVNLTLGGLSTQTGWELSPVSVAAPVAASWSGSASPAAPVASWDAPTPSAAPAWGAPVAEEATSWSAPVAEEVPVAAWSAPTTTPEAPAWGGNSNGSWDAPVGAPVDEYAQEETEDAYSSYQQAPTYAAAPRRGLSRPAAEEGWDQSEAAWSGGGDGPVARGSYGASFEDTPKKTARVITVTAPKGGTGKSTVTLNLASYLGLRLQKEGKRVCVIDSNFQQADTGKYLGHFSPTIVDLVRDPTGKTPERIENYLVHSGPGAIWALLGPATPQDANPTYVNAALYEQALDSLMTKFDYILIDTPVAEKYHDIFVNFALPRADYIIVPVTPNRATLHNVDMWLRDIVLSEHEGGAGVDPDKIGIVLNRAKDNVGCSEDDVRRELQAWRYIGLIPETDAWQRANNENELVAPMNYTELNEAFSTVLYEATGRTEEALLEDQQGGGSKKGGILGKFTRMFKR